MTSKYDPEVILNFSCFLTLFSNIPRSRKFYSLLSLKSFPTVTALSQSHIMSQLFPTLLPESSFISANFSLKSRSEIVLLESESTTALFHLKSLSVSKEPAQHGPLVRCCVSGESTNPGPRCWLRLCGL